MRSKVIEKYVYVGLGFPIDLEHVEMLKVDGEWTPKIDVKKVADEAIKALVTQRESLTGNQIKFIRAYFSMNLRNFAKIAGVTHTAANKWEKCGSEATKMHPNIEKMLRLYIYETVCLKTSAQKKKFYKVYLAVRNAPLGRGKAKHLKICYA